MAVHAATGEGEPIVTDWGGVFAAAGFTALTEPGGDAWESLPGGDLGDIGALGDTEWSLLTELDTELDTELGGGDDIDPVNPPRARRAVPPSDDTADAGQPPRSAGAGEVAEADAMVDDSDSADTWAAMHLDVGLVADDALELVNGQLGDAGPDELDDHFDYLPGSGLDGSHYTRRTAPPHR